MCVGYFHSIFFLFLNFFKLWTKYFVEFDAQIYSVKYPVLQKHILNLNLYLKYWIVYLRMQKILTKKCKKF